MDGGQEVIDSLLGYLAYFQSMMARFGEGIGVKSDKWVLRSMFFERVVKSEKAGEVFGICDEGSPDYKHLAVPFEALTTRNIPFFDSTTRLASGFVESVIFVCVCSYPVTDSVEIWRAGLS